MAEPFLEHLLDQTNNNISSIKTANSTPELLLQDGFPPPPLKVPKKIKRSRTAPAMVILKALNNTNNNNKQTQEPESSDSSESIRLGGLLLLVYLSLGVVIYFFNRDQFSGAGTDTHPVIDAFYFCIVTMCTIGYGDITPVTPFAKVFACFFVLIGFGFIDILLSGLVNYVLDLQENMILDGMGKKGKGKDYHECESQLKRRFSVMDFVVDVAKGRMRIRLKVGLALGVVLLSIGIGSLVLHLVEGLDWVDSVYLAVMSVTTVGYGDEAFKTTGGRWFASIWLLLSTLAVARAFLYLAEARVAKRHRRIADKILQHDITIDDLLSADLNNTNFISKSEYVVYKLQQMGKIGEKDIKQICVQFNKLDHNQSGKITLPNLFANL